MLETINIKTGWPINCAPPRGARIYVRALLTKVADTAEPIKAHVTRGMNELHKAS